MAQIVRAMPGRPRKHPQGWEQTVRRHLYKQNFLFKVARSEAGVEFVERRFSCALFVITS